MTASSTSPLRPGVPRHLQDCNGYCGPACVMMVLCSGGGTVEAQHEMFRRVREHARQANDRRPVKSPAESSAHLLNSRGGSWEKMFRSEPEPVAARIVQAAENAARPCLLLISKGMHWVVAFGRTQREDGSAAGMLLRDPAWAGMPGFFGLTTLPEKPTFVHTAGDSCQCLAADNPPGSVHERYMPVEELLSPRGLQGSPDWEGKGALALLPADAAPAAMLPRLFPALPLTGLTLQEEVRELTAALEQERKNRDRIALAAINAANETWLREMEVLKIKLRDLTIREIKELEQLLETEQREQEKRNREKPHREPPRKPSPDKTPAPATPASPSQNAKHSTAPHPAAPVFPAGGKKLFICGLAASARPAQKRN